MIYEWQPTPDSHNFGDALGRHLLGQSLTEKFIAHEGIMLCPIGSVISNPVLEHARWLGLTPYFLSCGWDGSELDPELVSTARFFGSRGPLTRNELANHGVHVKVTGDPGYAFPALLPPGIKTGKTILVPHLSDVVTDEDFARSGADVLLSPVLNNSNDVEEFARQLSGARFVLAGAMHAGIVADAYGVAFAPFRSETTGFVSYPLKWRDWLQSVAVVDTGFVSNVIQGEAWFDANVKPRLRSPKTWRHSLMQKKYSLRAFRRVATQAERIFAASSG